MPIDLEFRKRAVKTLSKKIGVYMLCDLDNVPVYVGQSKDGIRQRVQRHLTSARSDVISNRQIDVWEIAYVWEYPLENELQMNEVESLLFHKFHPKHSLMNGSVPPKQGGGLSVPKPTRKIQVMSNQEILEKKDPEQRLPRQAKHYADIVGHFLAVKRSRQIAGAMDAHFERLKKYHAALLNLTVDDD